MGVTPHSCSNVSWKRRSLASSSVAVQSSRTAKTGPWKRSRAKQSNCCSLPESTSSHARRANHPSCSRVRTCSKPTSARLRRARPSRGAPLPPRLEEPFAEGAPTNSKSSCRPLITRSWGLDKARRSASKVWKVTTKAHSPCLSCVVAWLASPPTRRKCSRKSSSETPSGRPAAYAWKGGREGSLSTEGYASCASSRQHAGRYGCCGQAIIVRSGGRGCPPQRPASAPASNDLPPALGPVTSSGTPASTSNSKPLAKTSPRGATKSRPHTRTPRPSMDTERGGACTLLASSHATSNSKYRLHCPSACAALSALRARCCTAICGACMRRSNRKLTQAASALVAAPQSERPLLRVKNSDTKRWVHAGNCR
mmetsp:Transcript_54077/g.161150  ORF Transcript_54077/g.161150 Transcript_54077/m.161150 type:complete len:368 (-) Transcript_54077:2041-3144(-)